MSSRELAAGLTPNADCPYKGRGNGMYKPPNNDSVLLHHLKNPQARPRRNLARDVGGLREVP